MSWIAIVIATVVNMGLGSLWFSQSVFGKQWMEWEGHSGTTMGGSRPLGLLIGLGCLRLLFHGLGLDELGLRSELHLEHARPDLQLVARAHGLPLVHALAVDERSVGRPEVLDAQVTILEDQRGMAPGDLRIVQHKGGAHGAAPDHPRPLEVELPSGIGALDDPKPKRALVV